MNKKELLSLCKEAKDSLDASYSVLPYEESANIYVLQSIASSLIIIIKLLIDDIEENENNTRDTSPTASE